MDLLDALKFVQGSVAKKELQEGLTHFRIVDGTVRGFNGTISLCSPVPLNIDCTPKAEPMLKAIAACDEAVQMTMLANGKLSIKSGGFKVSVDTLQKPTAHVEPEGTIHEIDGQLFLNGLSRVTPFISNDASRPWSCGVLVKQGSMYATNNASIIQYWFGAVFPVDCVVPRMAIKELLRIKKPPVRIQCTDTSMTFHYEDGCWLRTQLLELKWPNIDKIIERTEKGSDVYTLDTELFNCLEKIKPFCERDGRIYMENGVVRTHYNELDGASAMFRESKSIGVYNIDLIMQLKGLATDWDASRFNEKDERGLSTPIIFYGENLRGVIVGFRL